MNLVVEIKDDKYWGNAAFFKGTVARDFLAWVFFHGSTLYGPRISRLKGFSFLFCFRAVIRIF
jgi:hypothetical protein